MAESPPFTRISELHTLTLRSTSNPSIDSTDSHTALPSQPRIALNAHKALTDFLLRDLCTPILDRLAPQLYLISTASPSNISPLHFQEVKNRRIVITEDPKLHLVWYHDRIFLKPLPSYVLSYDFWDKYLCDDRSPLKGERRRCANAARGLLRSYYYLILYPSDLRVAQRDELQLIPKDVTWEQFCAFSSTFGDISNQDVAARYQYGELRLSRLNYLVRLLLFRHSYQEVSWQYSEYFASFYGPLLFVFGVLSVLLSAMQVTLAAEQLQSRGWLSMWAVCRWFSVTTLCALAAVAVWLLGLGLLKSLDEVMFTVKVKARARGSKMQNTVTSFWGMQTAGSEAAGV